MKNKKLILLSLLVVLLGSCSSYKIGHIRHPQIHTVAIGNIKNLTGEPRLALYMKSKLKERFMLDGAVTLTSVEKADIVVSGTVEEYKVRVTSTASKDYREKEDDGFRATVFNATLTFKYEVKTRKQWNVQDGSATGTAAYTEFLDQNEEKRNALKRASADAARHVVNNINEAW